MAGVGIEKKPLWQIAAATDIGRMRAHNEDSYAVLRTAQLRGVYDFALLVADGMGGRNAGEVASRTAVEAASQAILNNVQHVDAPALLRFAVEAAHVAIQQRAEGNPEYEGMGTTLVIALAKDREIWIASVGDSRAYVLRGERLLPLTEDHTFVAEQVRVGGMTLEQARHSRFRHMLTRAVGTSSVDYTPDVVPARLQPGDMLLLCTDGLTSMVWEEEMVRLLRKYRHDPDRACQSLIDAANAQGGQDNITVLLAADMRDTVADEEADGELLTVSELPTERNPLRRAARLMRRISLKQVVLGATALLVVAGAIMAIFLLRKPKPIPQLPPPPPRLDLATVLYESPRILLNKPLRGAPLVIAPDGNLYVMSEQGRVLRLSSDGKILTASAQPFSAAADPELKPDMVYFAVDPQGNLYVCDRANRRIVKYRSDGTLIGSIGEGVLKRPAALAVGADGSVYVIDAGKLTLFRAIPGGTKMALSPIGKYERVDVLGYGATGIVYLAWDSLLRKQVALKEINVQAGDMERFLEEARLLDRLNHPNIVRVHSVDKVEGKVLIAMEYVPGVNLQELLRQQGRLPIPQALDIAIQVLDALDYAHRNHTIHRDIKPGNILIRRDGVVKLVDFGLATILGTGSYAGGAGTYVYMAPEDFEEEERSDHRSDLWAVGVTLYEMVTGHRPFNASNPKNPFSWQEAVQKQQPPPLQQYVPDAPAALQTVIDRALAKRKEERFPTAGEFAQALRRVQVLLPDAGGETLAVVSAQAYGAQQRKESVAGASKSPRSAIVKVEPQEVSFGPVRQGEQCVAKVVVRSTNRKPLDARLASHPGWLYVHPPVLQRKQQVVTLTADTGMVSAQGALCDVVQFVNGEQRISIPVRLEVLPPRPQFRQVAYWYAPLFVSCLVPLFTVVLGSGDWSRWMPIGLELSGLLGAMLVLITMGAELRSGERMAAVLLMLTGLSATGTYLGVLGDPQNHPQGKIAVDLLTVMGAVLLLQLFSTRRWKWWAWVLVGLSLGLSGVIASVTRGGV